MSEMRILQERREAIALRIRLLEAQDLASNADQIRALWHQLIAVDDQLLALGELPIRTDHT